MANHERELAEIFDGITAAMALSLHKLLQLGYSRERAKAMLLDLVRDAVNEL